MLPPPPGESYAGHYIPAITAYILEMNAKGGYPKINLQAIAIGDGLIDPVSMAKSWGPFLYAHNLISSVLGPSNPFFSCIFFSLRCA